LFQFLFNYPSTLFAQGRIVLLAPLPGWVLGILMAAAAAGLAALIWWRLPKPASRTSRWRAAVIWALQSLLLAVLLLMLWQPALTVTELRLQQNVVAVLIDDSRSMGIVEDGASREAQARGALQGGVLAAVARRFQTRLYRFDTRLTRLPDLQQLQPTGAATHIGASLRQLAAETADLPVGAVVLLSDGEDNANGVDADTLGALRERHIPVHTVGFGAEQSAHDVEMDTATVAPRALANARLAAVVRFHQRGYAGRQSRLVVRDGEHVLGSRNVTFTADDAPQSETVLFNVGAAGVTALQFALDVQPGEQNLANNVLTRLVNVDAAPRSVLYVEGEPRWEYKFIRRAADDDHLLRLVSMLRTSENKLYRQNVQDPQELAAGFPTRAQDLFAYQGLIIGSVEATYFTPAQRELIRQFVDRRGGGLLLLGGRFALADGGWGASDLADLLPTVLPSGRNTFHVDPATVQLTAAGTDSPVTRLVDDPLANVERWKKLPYLMDYQDPGVPKPAAQVLASLTGGGRSMPMLITEPYGRGRSAVLATSGTWRWQMGLPLGDPSFELFWQQLLRWLVTDSHGHVQAAVDAPELQDDGHVALSAEVRDQDYQPVADAVVEAHILGPDGLSARVPLSPVTGTPGSYQADWNAPGPGDYLTELTAQPPPVGAVVGTAVGTAGRTAVGAAHAPQPLGRDVLSFRRVDGEAENFHTPQNRELLTRIAQLTGGRYWRPAELASLADQISYSPAGITTHGTRELWDMPALLLLILGLVGTEWLLRRRWGII
jgi:uncharacterized membrane protein